LVPVWLPPSTNEPVGIVEPRHADQTREEILVHKPRARDDALRREKTVCSFAAFVAFAPSMVLLKFVYTA
jgi:hypothetical protein